MRRRRFLRSIAASGLWIPFAPAIVRAQSQMLQSAIARQATWKKAAATGGGFITSGLVGWWKFDGDLTDSSGNNHGGSLVGSPTPGYITGEFGQAINLSGTQGVSVTRTADLEPSQLSISAWYHQASSDPVGYIVSKDHNSNYLAYNLGVGYYQLPGNFTFSVSSGDNTYAVASVSCSGLSAGWHHLVGTFNGSGVTLYLDNSATGPVAYSKAISYVGSYAIGIGCLLPSTAYFSLPLDDVRIYSRALSAGEVSSIYSGQG